MNEAPYHCPLSFASLQLKDLLHALSPLDHLIYLNNNGQPFIACCAQKYFMVQDGQIQAFKRVDIEQYQADIAKLILELEQTPDIKANEFSGVMLGLLAMITLLNSIPNTRSCLNLAYLSVSLILILSLKLINGYSIAMIRKQQIFSIIFKIY